MRAIQIAEYGDPKTIARVVDIPEPAAPSAGEVEIEILYAPVNPNDLLVMNGLLPHRPALPAVIGNEGVGRVIAIGADVDTVAVGDLVLPPLFGGTYTERMVIAADGLFALPGGADPRQLAMALINPVTASLMLSSYGEVPAGGWIVQNAGNSGVGRAVIAIGRAHGNRTISFVRNAGLIAELEAAGGDLVLVDDGDAGARIAAAVGEGRIHLALDGVSGPATARLAGLLSPGGTLVSYAMMSGEMAAPADLRALLGKGVDLRFFYMGEPRFAGKMPPLWRHSVRMIADGTIHVPIAATYPMEQIADAIAHVERGGKVMLAIKG